MRARPPSSPAAFALALALRFAAARPVPGPADAVSFYTVVDDETGETREKGLSGGIIAGVVVGAVLGFSLLFSLLWCWLDRQSADRRVPHRPDRRLWPWSLHASRADTVSRHSSATLAGPRASASTTNSSSSYSRTVVGSISSTKPLNPPSPPRTTRASRDEGRASDDSLPTYIQVHPPPKAVLARGAEHGRIAEWCAKAAAKIEGTDVTRVRSWEEGDPEKRRPNPFTA